MLPNGPRLALPARVVGDPIERQEPGAAQIHEIGLHDAVAGLGLVDDAAHRGLVEDLADGCRLDFLGYVQSDKSPSIRYSTPLHADTVEALWQSLGFQIQATGWSRLAP